ncbi:DUF397 domain-containing protein [Actinoplanes sp. NBC_00393]|uniref:DUF397 domain-containing protein n=1 Tax=Actinoplanes sp. NBC_00393 TaxID=2975953 RepID=UPI002E1F9A34
MLTPEAGVLEGAVWRKSSRSGSAGHCVEVAMVADGHYVGVRNSRQPDGAALVFTRKEWEAFAGGVKDGEFELPE